MKTSLIKKMTQITPYLVSAASLIFAAQFMYHTIQGSMDTPHIVWVIFTVILSIFVLIGMRNEFKNVRATKMDPKDFKRKVILKSALVLIGNTVLTYLVVIWFNTTTIFAASLICVLSAYLLPKHQPEAYSGSVAGMIGVYLCSHWSIIIVIGIMTAIVFTLFKPYFNGVGGRGGTIPYVATILSVRLILRLDTVPRPIIDRDLIVPSLIVIMFITVLTFYLHHENYLSVVKSAMLVSLIFTLIIPSDQYTITTAMFTGTIVGMSVSDRLDSYIHLLIVAVICSILFVPSFHILDGIGGKLGALSLLSYYGTMGLQYVGHWLFPEKIKLTKKIKEA